MPNKKRYAEILRGPMNSGAFSAICRELFGGWGWQSRVAEFFELSHSTVHRYKTGELAVPMLMAVALRLLLDDPPD